jgi:hypothetical protein
MNPQDRPTTRPPVFGSAWHAFAGPPIEPPKRWRCAQIRRIMPVVELVAVSMRDNRRER